MSVFSIKGLHVSTILQNSVSVPGNGRFLQLSGIRFAWNNASGSIVAVQGS
jgi:hypothetical protein